MNLNTHVTKRGDGGGHEPCFVQHRIPTKRVLQIVAGVDRWMRVIVDGVRQPDPVLLLRRTISGRRRPVVRRVGVGRRRLGRRRRLRLGLLGRRPGGGPVFRPRHFGRPDPVAIERTLNGSASTGSQPVSGKGRRPSEAAERTQSFFFEQNIQSRAVVAGFARTPHVPLSTCRKQGKKRNAVFQMFSVPTRLKGVAFKSLTFVGWPRHIDKCRSCSVFFHNKAG